MTKHYSVTVHGTCQWFISVEAATPEDAITAARDLFETATQPEPDHYEVDLDAISEDDVEAVGEVEEDED